MYSLCAFPYLSISEGFPKSSWYMAFFLKFVDELFPLCVCAQLNWRKALL
jgi:hypothetical protein